MALARDAKVLFGIAASMPGRWPSWKLPITRTYVRVAGGAEAGGAQGAGATVGVAP